MKVVLVVLQGQLLEFKLSLSAPTPTLALLNLPSRGRGPHYSHPASGAALFHPNFNKKLPIYPQINHFKIKCNTLNNTHSSVYE